MNTELVARHPIALDRAAATIASPQAATRAAVPSTHRVGAGCALSLGRQRGELVVVSGRAWLTCRGDLRDHVLDAGERIFLPAGHLAVVAPLNEREHLVLSWRPHGRRVVRA